MKKVKSKLTGNIGRLDFDSKEGTLSVAYYDLYTKELIINYYKSLEDLCEEWEDYEEPKSTIKDVWFNSTLANGHFVEIDFMSDEEAEKAVEKLKAWKRLKACGFKFSFWDRTSRNGDAELSMLAEVKEYMGITEDLDLLFGGKE